MTDTPARPRNASAVIIGAGIVGNSLVHHLALLGWRDLVLVDKGPMPNPGGSTGHASNFIFPIEYSKMMFELTEDSTAQYKDLGVFTQSGGIEVARTPERMIELRRRCTQAKSWGIPAELLTPGEVNKLVPYLDESVILGGAHFPTVGVVDSLRAGTLMREAAQRSGALTVLAGTEVYGISVAGGRVAVGDDQRGRDRDRERRDLLRRLVTADRPDGRRPARAHPDRAPDDQRRPDRAVRRHAGRDLLPDRPRRRHQHVRAPARRRHGGRLVRAPPDHRPAGRDPVHRGVGALAHRDAVHPGGLRPAAGAGARADARTARRRAGRHQVRDQRPDLDDPRRAPAARRDARGQGAVVGRGELDQGRPRLRPGGGRADVRPGAHGGRARGRRGQVLPLPANHRARPRPGPGGLQQDVRHRAPGRAVGVRPAFAGQPGVRAGTLA